MILCSRCRTGLLTHWPVLCNLKHHVKYTIKAVWSLRNRTSWEHSRPTMPKVKVNKGPHPNYQWKREHHWWQRFVLETKNLDLMFGSSKNLHSWKKWSGKINQSRNSWNGSSIGLVRYTIHVYKHVYTINKSMYIYIYIHLHDMSVYYTSVYCTWHDMFHPLFSGTRHEIPDFSDWWVLFLRCSIAPGKRVVRVS